MGPRSKLVNKQFQVESDGSLEVTLGFRWYINRFENLLYSVFASHQKPNNPIPTKVWNTLHRCEMQIARLLLAFRASSELLNIKPSADNATISIMQGHLCLIRGLLHFLYGLHPDPAATDFPKRVWKYLRECEKELSTIAATKDRNCNGVECMDDWVCCMEDGLCHPPNGGSRSSSRGC